MKIVGAAGYDVALRERIVAAVADGLPVKEAARHFSVNVMTVYSDLKRYREGRLHVVGTPTGRPRRLTAVHEAQLLRQLDTHRDATLTEHAHMVEAATGLTVHFRTVNRAFARLNVTYKKNAGRQRAE
jgi:transposase